MTVGRETPVNGKALMVGETMPRVELLDSAEQRQGHPLPDIPHTDPQLPGFPFPGLTLLPPERRFL